MSAAAGRLPLHGAVPGSGQHGLAGPVLPAVQLHPGDTARWDQCRGEVQHSAEEKCSTQLRRGALQTRECYSGVECYCEIRAEHHLFVVSWSTLNIPPLCLTLVAVTSHGQLSLTHSSDILSCDVTC